MYDQRFCLASRGMETVLKAAQSDFSFCRLP